jgi:DNA-directed RNA polymerase-4/5 subunit 2
MQVEVVRDPVRREVFIYTDGGRILRPLLLVQNQRLVLSRQHLKKLKVMMRLHGPGACWTYLLKEGVVELLGIEEEEKVMVATNGQDLEKAREYAHAPVYTHSEIDSSFLLGLGAVMIPFLQHNQALRNLHQSEKHCRQAIGYYCTNLWSRADSSAHHLFYPQKPIVTTRAADCLQKPELMNGQVAIVAIQSFAYNQEDSIVMNQASIDRGLFRSAHYKIHRGEERKNVDEHFSKPSTSDHKGWTHAWSGLDYKACLDKVDDDGFPCVGENLTKGNIVIGKLTAEQGRPKLSNTSTHLKLHQKGHVDQVLLANEEDGHRISKVRLRFTRAPQAGDKFSSLHGQKGVIGAVFPQEDLPYTRQGIVPDIIINPHALPSRQTFGQIMECLLGKVVATSGKPCFATRAETPQRVNELLFQYHYGRGGAEYMCNGTTGMPLEALITMGPTFYQRLDHMVEDKIKFRGIGGSINPLTHQPVRDRNSLGGVKFGEMERDCMLGHGASSTLRERYFLLSDPYKMNICAACRRPATMDASRTPKCHFCKNGKHIVQIQIPYACKLLWQELLSMGISVYMDTKLC